MENTHDLVEEQYLPAFRLPIMRALKIFTVLSFAIAGGYGLVRGNYTTILACFALTSLALSGFFSLIIVTLKFISTRNWVKTIATVDKLGRVDERIHAFFRESRWGRIRIRYIYEYKTRNYIGSHVSLLSYLAIMGDYDEKFFSTLLRKKETSQKVDIWINPNHPSESLLSIRFPTLAYIGFLTMMSGMFVAWLFAQMQQPLDVVVWFTTAMGFTTGISAIHLIASRGRFVSSFDLVNQEPKVL